MQLDREEAARTFTLRRRERAICWLSQPLEISPSRRRMAWSVEPGDLSAGEPKL